MQSDLLAGVAGDAFHLIVSNPPYVAEAELAGLEPEVAVHEPRLATAAGADGFDVYRRLLPEAAARLAPRRRAGARVRRRPGRRRWWPSWSGSGTLMPGWTATWQGSSGWCGRRGGDAGGCAGSSWPQARWRCFPPTPSTAIACAAADCRCLPAALRLKQRPPTQATAIMLGSVQGLLAALPELPERQAELCRELLPGTLTLLVPNPAGRFAHVCGDDAGPDRRAGAAPAG